MRHAIAADEVIVAMSSMGESVLPHRPPPQCRKSCKIQPTCDWIQESSSLHCDPAGLSSTVYSAAAGRSVERVTCSQRSTSSMTASSFSRARRKASEPSKR
jgi:hypothetical protein